MSVIVFGAGVLGGIVLIAMLPGMPWISSVPDPTNNLDLGAQRSMAAAAWWMVVLTALAGMVGTASLFLIRENLLAAREVNRHAERSAKAAEEAVAAALHTAEITREMGQAQSRCYLVVKSAELSVRADDSFRLLYHFLNSGHTPARSVRTTTEIWVEMEIPGRGWVDVPHHHKRERSRSDIPGHEAREGWTEGPHGSPFTEYVFKDAGKYPWRILVDITLSSRDVFGIGQTETAYYGTSGEAGQTFYGKHTLSRIHR